MLSLFSRSRTLHFAATATKGGATTRPGQRPGLVHRKEEKPAKKKRDPNKTPKVKGYNLYDLIHLVPMPKDTSWDAHETWKHKFGFGLKAFRKPWMTYDEPSYWTITKFRPANATKNEKEKAWGFFTWRGKTESNPRSIVAASKRDWKFLLDGTQEVDIKFPTIKKHPEKQPTTTAASSSSTSVDDNNTDDNKSSSTEHTFSPPTTSSDVDSQSTKLNSDDTSNSTNSDPNKTN